MSHEDQKKHIRQTLYGHRMLPSFRDMIIKEPDYEPDEYHAFKATLRSGFFVPTCDP